MDYSDDSCTNGFTTLQAARIQASIAAFRPSLIATAFEIGPGITGNWFDVAEAGHGFSIEVLPGNLMLAEWYVYAPNGGPVWIVATGPITGNTAVLQGFQKIGVGGASRRTSMHRRFRTCYGERSSSRSRTATTDR
jgi:hypothetical protein